MDNNLIVIYAIIIGVAVLSSVIKRIRKANNPQQNYKKPINTQQKNIYNKPQTAQQKPQTTQPKSLEDILQTLLNEQKPVVKPNQQTHKTPNTSDKTLVKSTSDELADSFEKLDEERLKIQEEKYYGYDTELKYNKELEDYDETTDHHVHGAGFDVTNEKVQEEENEWANIDWRKAVITAEILRRPDY